MWRCARAFEWGNHYRLARHAGLTKDEILAIRTTAPERDLEGSVALVVRAADEVVDDGCIGEATMASLASVFPGPLLDEFVYLVAGYRMYATASASKRVERVAQQDAWPPDGIGPAVER